MTTSDPNKSYLTIFVPNIPPIIVPFEKILNLD